MSLTSNRRTKTTAQMILFFFGIYNLLGIHIRPLCYQNNLTDTGGVFFFFLREFIVKGTDSRSALTRRSPGRR